MSAHSDLKDRHAQTYLNVWAKLDDAYLDASMKGKEDLVFELQMNDWPNIEQAFEGWACLMQTPTATRCCIQFISRGPNLLMAMLPLPQRVTWLEAALRAVEKGKTAGDAVLDARQIAIAEVNVLGNLGIAYRDRAYLDRGLLRAAARSQLRALRMIDQLSSEQKPQERKAKTLCNLSVVFIDRGKYRWADKCLDNTLAILSAGDRSPSLLLANTHNNRGLVRKHLFQKTQNWTLFDAALHEHEHALLIARQIRSLQAETDSLGNIGDLHYIVGDFAKAEQFHRDQLAKARDGAKLWSEGNARKALGLDVASQQDRREEGRKILFEAQDFFRSIGELEEVAKIDTLLKSFGDTVTYSAIDMSKE